MLPKKYVNFALDARFGLTWNGAPIDENFATIRNDVSLGAAPDGTVGVFRRCADDCGRCADDCGYGGDDGPSTRREIDLLVPKSERNVVAGVITARRIRERRLFRDGGGWPTRTPGGPPSNVTV